MIRWLALKVLSGTYRFYRFDSQNCKTFWEVKITRRGKLKIYFYKYSRKRGSYFCEERAIIDIWTDRHE